MTGASNIDQDNKLIINRYTNVKYINSYLNDILLSCKGTVGKVVINDIGDIHVARQFMSIKSFINIEFLMILLNFLSDDLKNNAKSMIPGIDRQQVLSRVILLPPLIEQKKISNKVNNLLLYLN